LKGILAGVGVYALPVGASAVIAALLMACAGCTVRDGSGRDGTSADGPAPQARPNINVNVDVDLRRPCPTCRPQPRPGNPNRNNPTIPPINPSLPPQYRRDDQLRRAIALPDTASLSTELPAVDLPLESRCRNYSGGSCVCASTINVLRWQGREDLADELRRICSGGQSSTSLIAKMDRLNLPYAYTDRGDVAFLDWCSNTRRGATIFWKPAHSCTLVGFTAEEAIVLDNNRVGKYEYTPREEFIRRWRGYGGFALTPLAGAPAPPPMHAGCND